VTYELTGQIEELLGQRTRGSGVNGSYFCPFHEERTPSFSIHLEEGLWYCFGCGRKGNLARLYRELGQELTEEQRHDLLIRSVYREPEPISNFAPLANAHRRAFKGPAGQALWQSFARVRPISLAAADHFGLGYSDKKGALAFPYWNDDGTVTAIKYRHRDGSKSSEGGSKRSLYGVSDIVGAATVLVCEGESDTLAAWSRTNKATVCGSPGAGVSEKTWANWGLDFLFARQIYVAFDADEAGDAGAETAMRVLGGERCIRMRPTRGKDLSEHLINGGTFAELGLDT
jgi:DNA primase